MSEDREGGGKSSILIALLMLQCGGGCAAGKGSGLPWGDDDEKKLHTAVEAARNGLMCFYVASSDH